MTKVIMVMTKVIMVMTEVIMVKTKVIMVMMTSLIIMQMSLTYFNDVAIFDGEKLTEGRVWDEAFSYNVQLLLT